MKTVMANLSFLKNMSIPSDMPEEGCYMEIPGFKGNVTRAELQAMIDKARSVSVHAVVGTGGSGGGADGRTVVVSYTTGRGGSGGGAGRAGRDGE